LPVVGKRNSTLSMVRLHHSPW